MRPPAIRAATRPAALALSAMLLCSSLSSLALDVVAIDGKPYTEVDLTGCTKAEMQEAFLAELAKLSDQEFEDRLKRWRYPKELSEPAPPPPAGTPQERRRAAAIKLFEREYVSRLDNAALSMILARTLDRTLACHGVALADYVDIGVLDRAMQRHGECWRFLHQHRTDDESQTDTIYDEACTRFGLALGREEFAKLRSRDTAAWLPSRAWPARWGLDSEAYRSAHCRAAALAYVIRSACAPGGSAWDMAVASSPALMTGFETVRIAGYAGSPSGLEELLRSGGEDRYANAGNLARFGTLCAVAGLPLDIRHEQVVPAGVQRMALDGPLPTLGVPREMNDGTWQAARALDPNWGQKLSAEVREDFLRGLAVKLAIRPYLPKVLGFAPYCQFDMTRIVGAANGPRDPFQWVASRMTQTENPVLKPYPDAPFREYAEGRAWSQTWFARLAASVFRADAAQQNALLDELVAYAGSRTTTAGRQLAAKTLETAAAHGGLDAAVKERAERELAALRAAPPAAPGP